nr:MAG TPA: hypothetical protein [Caudoviricetes sp.]
MNTTLFNLNCNKITSKMYLCSYIFVYKYAKLTIIR